MTADSTIKMGIYADGTPVYLDITASSIGVSGATRSGKSTAVYGLLSRLPDRVRVWGADPSGLLFAPWPPEPWRVSTTRDLPAVVKMLRGVVAEMDRRINWLLTNQLDQVPFGLFPHLLGVFEEYPGLLNRLRDYDRENGLKPADRLEAKTLALLTRIFLEGRKVGISVLLIAQQLLAELTGSTVIRDQLGTLLTFRQGAVSLRLVHPDIETVEIDAARRFLPGQGFIQEFGSELRVWRAYRTDYASYLAAVKARPSGS